MMVSHFGMNLKVHMQIHDVLIDHIYIYIAAREKDWELLPPFCFG